MTLNVSVKSLDKVENVAFADVGKRTGEEKFYTYTNCGTGTEKLKFTDTFSTESGQEIEFTQEVKTSTSFSGKLNTEFSIFDVGIKTEGNASLSKEISLTDRNKRTTVEKKTREEVFEFIAPPKTRVIYRATTGGGIKKLKFSGNVLVTGIYHYRIGNIWDQNANIELALPDEKERIFPFSGTLSTINLTTLTLERNEEPLSTSFCKSRAELAKQDGAQLQLIDVSEGKKLMSRSKSVEVVQTKQRTEKK
ncbi:hypothetical protein SAMN05216338_1002136 [Bradyrhizobium sp. Rc2d]|nr:hypothetical protein SAMN05216338_1002136 [Bradyrhizobium sp. Rc2d]